VPDGATVGSSRAYRLDPHALPVRGVLRKGDAVPVTFIIEPDRAIVTRPVTAGATITQAMPLAEFLGVAVSMDPVGDNGDVRGSVALLHRDAELSLPVVVSSDPEILSADWQAWARVLGLRLLIIGQDGSIGEPLARGIAMAPQKPRRRHSYFAKRRPRFLTRRKTGRTPEGERLTGREIIARN
jgi:hypothetical protein